MGKTLLAAVAATGVAATAAPATFLASGAGSGGGNTNPERQEHQNQRETPVPTPSTTREAPQAQTPAVGKLSWTSKLVHLSNPIDSRIDCLKERTGEIDFSNANSAKSELDSDVSSFYASANSCLLVEYYKQNYTGNKWWGEFRFVWVLKDIGSGKGLITVVNAKTADGGLKGEAQAYFLELKGGVGLKPWKIKNSKKVNVNNISAIPKSNESLGTEYKDYWGFGSDLSKACEEGKCSGSKGNATHKYATGTFATSNIGGSIKEWSSNFDTWFKKTFGWDKVTTAIESVKGTWKLTNGKK